MRCMAQAIDGATSVTPSASSLVNSDVAACTDSSGLKRLTSGASSECKPVCSAASCTDSSGAQMPKVARGVVLQDCSNVTLNVCNNFGFMPQKRSFPFLFKLKKKQSSFKPQNMSIATLLVMCFAF